MATVNKDFRVKHGLIVEGENGTINGSDIITEDAIVGGTQTNITVTYNPTTKVVDFVAENGVTDSTTDDLEEGTENLYFTDQRAIDAVGGSATPDNEPNTVVKRDGNGDFAAENITASQVTGAGFVKPITVAGTPENFVVIGGSSGAIADSVPTVGAFKYTLGNFGNLFARKTADASGDTEVYVDILKDSDGSNEVYLGTNSSEDNRVATQGGVTSAINDLDTDDIEEGSANLYYTDTRARNSVSAGDGLDYNSTSGEFSADLGNGLQIDGTGQIEIDNNVVATQTDLSDDIDAHSDLTTGVHGVTGDVVGTTDTQTLSNKTLGSNLDAGEFKIVNLDSPSQPSDAATKGYVDGVAAGLNWKPAVNLLSNVDTNMTGNTETLVIDGHAALDSTDVGYRILLTGQAIDTENGIYTYTEATGVYTLVRADDADTYEELVGAAVFVMEGTTYGSTSWVQSNHYLSGFGSQEWDQFSGTGTYISGNGISFDGNVIEIDETVTATRTYVQENFVTLDSLPGQLDDYIPLTDKGEADGVATLDETGQVPVSQLGHVTEAIDGLTTDDIEEGSTNLYFTDTRAVDALEAVVPNFTAVEVNSVAKQVAAVFVPDTAGIQTVYSWAKSSYRSAEFLVKVAYDVHTEISKVLLTLDSSDNIAITEYAIVGTNGSASDISASVNGSNIQLLVEPTGGNSTITVVGTLLV